VGDFIIGLNAYRIHARIKRYQNDRYKAIIQRTFYVPQLSIIDQ